MVMLAEHYVGGEESALVAAVSGRPGVPAFRPDKSVPLTVGRRPALVHNTETVAHIGLIARYGAAWFRHLGPPEAPGTCLVTVSGAVRRPGVVEVEVGSPVSDIISGAEPWGGAQAVLVGGYGGSWVAGEATDVAYSPAGLRSVGAAMGAGILAVLPPGACGLREAQRVAQYMAGQSAGQCGPCLFGLPAIAADLALIVDGHGDRPVLDRLLLRCGAVAGRGACRHPDGAVRQVRTALEVFGADLRAHVRGQPCAGAHAAPWLPVPSYGGERELVLR
jgi:NADH:ubiquinone oxidoreductase subunit F (NADH-binding)